MRERHTERERKTEKDKERQRKTERDRKIFISQILRFETNNTGRLI